MKATMDDARKFISNISKEDKVAIIHHDDLDGFASGVVFYDYCKQKGAKVKSFLFNYMDKINKDKLQEFNKIIITDVAAYGMLLIDFPESSQILYTDHHDSRDKISDKILELNTSEEGYIPSSRTALELTNVKAWLALAGIIGDSGDLYPENNSYIEKQLSNLGMTLSEFKRKVSDRLEYMLLYFKKGERAFELIEEIGTWNDIGDFKKYFLPVEEEYEYYLNNFDKVKEKIGKINFLYFEPKYQIRKNLGTDISKHSPDEIFIIMSPKGIDKVGITARHQSPKANMPEIISLCVEGLEDVTYGKHPRACGGIIQKKDLQKFKENLKAHFS